MPKLLAISVDHVSKQFKLPHEKVSSVKSALINLARRKRGYEIQHVLDDISFDVQEGEFLGIVGRNGSGKSTLLKLLAGIYTPTDGKIQINGRLTPFIELGVGFNPELTGRANVFLNGALLGFNRRQMEAIYDDIVSFAELERFMDQKLKNYSSGMQVRLAFSIAIRAQTEILLIDEVLAVGDAAFQRKCFDYFMQIKRDKRTMVLVTHDMGAVNQYCDRAIMIEKGRIVKSGKPDKVAQAYRKLFNDELEAVSRAEPTSDKRWGTGKLLAEQTTVRVTPDDLTITCRYRATAELPAPILGFTIYSPNGSNLLEGNTLRMDHPTSALKRGQTVEIAWRLPNLFATGTYDVSVACCDQSTTEFYDWLNNAASFIISKEGSTAGMIDPTLTIMHCTFGK